MDEWMDGWMDGLMSKAAPAGVGDTDQPSKTVRTPCCREAVLRTSDVRHYISVGRQLDWQQEDKTKNGEKKRVVCITASVFNRNRRIIPHVKKLGTMTYYSVRGSCKRC